MKEIPQMRGQELDDLAIRLGLIRKTIWWFIKESDASLRKRIQCRVCQLNNRQVLVPGVKVI